MSRDTVWTNSDGLAVGFGTHTADNSVLSVTATEGIKKVATALIDLTTLEDTDSVTAASFSPNQITLPRGSYITNAYVVVTATADSAGDAGTLDIGTYAWKDGTVDDLTADDVDGIDADIAQAALALGAAVECDGALVNGTVPVGATSNSQVTVVAAYQSAAFTAGEILLTVEYIVPSTGAEGAAF